MPRAASAVTAQLATPTKDLERYVGFLQGTSLGPHQYVALLGMDAYDLPTLLKSVRRGFAYKVFDRLIQNIALSQEQVSRLVGIPQRTLTRRKHEGRFLPNESDRLLRAARLFGAVLSLFEGNRDAATAWLERPQPALGGAVPLELIRTEFGALEVERLVHRLEHGVFS